MSVLQKIVRCNREPCGMPAKYQIALKVWRIGSKQHNYRKPDTEVLTSLCVCERHRWDTTTAGLMSPENKSSLIGQLSERGFQMPDIDETELRFLPLKNGKKFNPAKFRADEPPAAEVVANSERKKHQCHYDGCDSPAEWDAHVILVGTSIKADTTIRVCDRHRDEAAAFILNDRNRDGLLNLLRENGIDGVDVRQIRVAFGRWEKEGDHEIHG